MSRLLRVAALHCSRGCHDETESWDVGRRSVSGPGRHLGGKAVAILMEGTYIGRTSREVLISDGSQTATTDDPVFAKNP